MDSQWVDMSDPAEEPDDWQEAWDAMAETMDAEEPPASPSVADWHGALAAPETWQPWEWDEALIRSLLPLVTYGPGLRKEAGR